MIKIQIYKKLIKNPTKNIHTVDGQHRKVRQSLTYLHGETEICKD